MNDYYLELGHCNNYQDVLNIIARINGEIDYCISIRDNKRLVELRKVLTQITVISNYIIKKRFEVVMPLLIQERKEMLVDMKNNYIYLYQMLDKFYKLNLGKYQDIDNLPDMNEWIGEIISVYGDYGYQVTLDDFTDIFDEKASDYKRDNYIVYEYMKLIFENMNELDSPEFTKLLFRLDEGDYIKLTDANPILDIMSMAINRFNNRHKDLFKEDIKDINKVAKHLNLGEININNIYEIRNILSEQINELESKLKELDEGNYSFVLSLYEDKFITEDELDIDIKIYEFCNKVTNNVYSSMDKNTREEFFSDLYEIMDIIIKLKIFDRVSSEYLEYSKNSGYDKIKGELLLVNEERDSMLQKISDKKLQIKQEKNKSIFSNLSRKKTYGLEYELDRLNKELESINKKLEECSIKKSVYIIDFVNGLVRTGKVYNIEGFDSVNKLFGVFDFDMLPPSSSKVNEMKLFKKYGIKLPSVGSEEFNELSIECLKFINNSIFIKRSKHNLRMMSLVNDRTLDDIVNHKYDYLMDMVSDKEVENIVKKR